MREKSESETIIIEKGGFEKYYYRKGSKYRRKTTRHRKNPMKVTLAKIGNLELYVFPYDYPDKVFIGVFPYSQSLSKTEIGSLMKFYNKSRWFLDEKWAKNPHFTKRAKIDSTLIQKAYAKGIQKAKEARS